MLGDFLTRGLVLVLGYAYPAFECFKTVEKNKVEIGELRFWCQYWIIVAAIAVFERIGDIFISWLPMYGEAKLAFFIYLWSSKTKGTTHVYESLVRPYVAKHETDIDRKLQELKARAWDLAIHHCQKFTKIGQQTFFQFLEYMATQSSKIAKTPNTDTEKPADDQNQYTSSAAPPPSPTGSPSFHNAANRQRTAADRRRPPLPPSVSANASGLMSPKSEASRIHLRSQTAFIHKQEDTEPEANGGSGSGNGSPEESDANVDHRLHAARLRLRRNKGFR